MRKSVLEAPAQIISEYRTRDPFEIMAGMNINVFMSDSYSADGLKGYSAILNGVKYAVINANLPSEYIQVVAAHELGHFVLHMDTLVGGVLGDFDISDPVGRLEREANYFAADLLLDDADVKEAAMRPGADAAGCAAALDVPAPFLLFKLFSMAQRGCPLRLPSEPDSTFMRHR